MKEILVMANSSKDIAKIITDSATNQLVKVSGSPAEPVFSDFLSFIKDDLTPATTELAKLNDNNRIHIQKLIFTNLVDRFDYTIDKSLLSLVNHSKLRESLLGNMQTPVTEQKLFSFLLQKSDELEKSLFDTLRGELRNSILRERHSKKLGHLFQILAPEIKLQKPVVNESNGQILKTRKANSKIPLSVIGYADWLYCRRNAIVHGGSSMKMSDQDMKALNKQFNVQPAKSIKLNVGSIQNAANFYKCVVAILNP